MTMKLGIILESVELLKLVKKIQDKCSSYLDTSVKIVDLDDETYKNKFDDSYAHYNKTDNTIYFNAYKLSFHYDKKRIIAHEFGHVIEDRVLNKHHYDFIKLWDTCSSKLNSPQRHNVSEGFAELFAIFITDNKFKRITNNANSEFAEMLE